MKTVYCYVHKLGKEDHYLCLSQKQERDECPYMEVYSFSTDRFCSHPNRAEIKKKPLPKGYILCDFEWV